MSRLDSTIDDLVANLVPVRPQSMQLGQAALLSVALLSLAGTFLLLGLREDVARLAPSPVIGVSGGLMLLLALAAGSATMRMARPQIGATASGVPWMLAALLLLPLVALIGFSAEPTSRAALDPGYGLRCFAVGTLAGIATIAFLLAWLRRGAPVRLRAAAWLAGLCGGAVGALAVTLECGGNGVGHIGIWHVAVVLFAGLSSRLLLPGLLKW